MKRGTPDHPKARKLAKDLNLARYEVVGLLESIWHFAAGYAKRGDIGRFSDLALADHLGWEAGSHEALIRCLVASGWLDRCPCHRLRVHDWPDHADQTVARCDEVKKRGFLECYGTDYLPSEEDMLVTTSVIEVDADLPLPLPLPVPTPEPVPEPVITLASASASAPPRKGGWVGEACDDWNERYGPGSANGGRIGQALSRIVKGVAKSLHEPEPQAWSGTVRPAWRRYLAETTHPSPSPQDFAAHFADWTTATESTAMVPRGRASPPNSARAQKGLDGINQLIEGGLKGDGTL